MNNRSQKSFFSGQNFINPLFFLYSKALPQGKPIRDLELTAMGDNKRSKEFYLITVDEQAWVNKLLGGFLHGRRDTIAHSE
jgi:hypothetical protein